MKSPEDVGALHWQSVHGVIVMKKYLMDNKITLTNKRFNESRHTKKELIPHRLSKSYS